jgi:hypothetical protein
VLLTISEFSQSSGRSATGGDSHGQYQTSGCRDGALHQHCVRDGQATVCHTVFSNLLLRVIVPAMVWRLHSLRLDVAVVQQQLHLLRAPMRVHSHKRIRAPAAAQPRRNEQALPVECLGKFYPSGDMSGSVPVYVTQVFHTVNRACLSCSPVSIVSRNRSGAAKPR